MSSPPVAIPVETFNNVTLLLSEVAAMLDALGQLAPIADSLNEHTLQTLALMAEGKAREVYGLLTDGPLVKVTA